MKRIVNLLLEKISHLDTWVWIVLTLVFFCTSLVNSNMKYSANRQLIITNQAAISSVRAEIETIESKQLQYVTAIQYRDSIIYELVKVNVRYSKNAARLKNEIKHNQVQKSDALRRIDDFNNDELSSFFARAKTPGDQKPQ